VLVQSGTHIEVIAVIGDLVVKSQVARAIDRNFFAAPQLRVSKSHIPNQPSVVSGLMGLKYVELAVVQVAVLSFEVTNQRIDAF